MSNPPESHLRKLAIIYPAPAFASLNLINATTRPRPAYLFVSSITLPVLCGDAAIVGRRAASIVMIAISHSVFVLGDRKGRMWLAR